MNEITRKSTDDKALDGPSIYESFMASPYLSKKYKTYFQVYSDLFGPYRKKNITFVEIGVLNGGSLFMWRNYLGEGARIIGIDLNPEALRWIDHGFEIYIGSQSDENFWESFYNKVGKIDILLDDGGHTYEQQIVTIHQSLEHINDGGLLVVEDTHTSYLKEFGYPSKYSLMEWMKSLANNINSRFIEVPETSQKYKNFVYSFRLYESILCLEINRKKCINNYLCINNGETVNADDYRYIGTNAEKINSIQSKLKNRLKVFKKNAKLYTMGKFLFSVAYGMAARINNVKLKKYF